jgi:hypothetical protein
MTGLVVSTCESGHRPAVSIMTVTSISRIALCSMAVLTAFGGTEPRNATPSNVPRLFSDEQRYWLVMATTVRQACFALMKDLDRAEKALDDIASGEEEESPPPWAGWKSLKAKTRLVDEARLAIVRISVPRDPVPHGWQSLSSDSLGECPRPLSVLDLARINAESARQERAAYADLLSTLDEDHAIAREAAFRADHLHRRISELLPVSHHAIARPHPGIDRATRQDAGVLATRSEELSETLRTKVLDVRRAVDAIDHRIAKMERIADGRCGPNPDRHDPTDRSRSEK